MLARAAIRVLLSLPDDAAVRLGGAMGGAAYWLLGKYRRRTLSNLQSALGERMDEAERRRTAKAVFRNAGRSLVEFILLRRWSAADIEKRVRFAGAENYDPIKGRGALVATGHFGNWELAAAASVQCLGVSLGAVARRQSNRRMDKLLNEGRRRAGIEIFARGKGVRPIMKHLKDGKVLAIVMDQDTRKGQGIFVPFMGKLAHTQRGPGFLACRMQAPILPVFMVRDENGLTHTCHVEEPIMPPPGPPTEEGIERLTRAYTEALERYVRKYPSQWMWMHDRWRQRPEDEAPGPLFAAAAGNEARG